MFHLHLVRAEPADSSTVTAPPAAIRLWFSERPEIAVTAVALSTTGGSTIALDKPVMANGTDTSAVVVNVKGAMKPGRYVVHWRSASADMHPMRGQYTFTLAASREP